MRSQHLDGVLAEIAKVKAEKAKTSVKVEPTIEERNARIMNLLEQGVKAKDVADRMNVTPATVYQLKSLAKKDKPVESIKQSVEGVKPLREKDIVVKPVVVEKAPKQSIVEPVEDKTVNTSSEESNYLKTQINDLTRQLDKYREMEKELHLQLIEQKMQHEKSLLAERTEKEKAYQDYVDAMQENQRYRKQVEDLLMVDGLNIGLMQQNLMFRERFGKMQEGERL